MTMRKPKRAKKTEQAGPPEFIFSGDYSKVMWGAINGAENWGELRSALYFVCCRIQELEGRAARPWRERDYR